VARLSTLAREHDVEAVSSHDRHTLPAEAIVKVLLVPRMELVDAQLVHTRLAVCGGGNKKTRTQHNP
jgi:hypothetical protein